MRTRPVTTHYYRNGKQISIGHACTVETAIIAAVRRGFRFTTAQVINGRGVLKAEVIQTKNGVTHISRTQS